MWKGSEHYQRVRMELGQEEQITTEEPTRMVFRVMDGEVFALMHPDDAPASPGRCLSYAYIGQHSEANPRLCIDMSRPASKAERLELERELELIGYKVRVMQRLTRRK